MGQKTLSISHHQSPAAALASTKRLLTNLGAKYADQMTITQEEWNDNTCTFAISASGLDITGTIKVQPASIEIVCNLPFLASAFWGQIQSAIIDEARPLLS